MSLPFITFVLLNHIQQSMLKKRSTIATLLLLITTIALADMPRDYYPDYIEGLNKEDLKTELHLLVKEHYRIQYGAKGTWVVFRDSDVRPDGSIWDMYSDIERYFPASGSHREMNIEHSVPKSWWGDDYPYTVDGSFDLHHLVPSDATANSKKSNYALGEVYGTPSFDNGVSKVGKATGYSFNVFEPADEYKGDFARMYMYFVTCYQDYTWRSLGTNMFITGDYPTLNEYAQELLLRWHRQDPVSKKEVDRNNAVYKHQRNRNPFIDYPHMAEYIWGDSIDYAFRFEGSGIVAPTLNVKSGDIIYFDSEVEGGSRSKYYSIAGENITQSITVQCETSAHFTVEPAVLAAEDVVAGRAQLRITYHPADFGIHQATITLSSKELPRQVELVVKGLCMPQLDNIIRVDEMKSSYSQRDADMILQLRNCTEAVTWYIDGTQLPDGRFSPSSLAKGMHTISFKTAHVSGKVRVMITQ